MIITIKYKVDKKHQFHTAREIWCNIHNRMPFKRMITKNNV